VEIVSDRRYRFPVARDEVWRAMASVGDYRRWWPWLRALEAEALAAGDVWTCVVQPPLPYRLTFEVRLVDVVAPSDITAEVTGDVVGRARLAVRELPAGTEIRLQSWLGPGSRALQAVAAVARPLVRRGHDWVFDTGAHQFRDRALHTPG